jgi:hypothetical protein
MESLEIYDSHVDAIKAHQDGHTLRLQWENRCKAAEEYLKLSFNDPFQTNEQNIAYLKWRDIVKSMEGK